MKRLRLYVLMMTPGTSASNAWYVEIQTFSIMIGVDHIQLRRAFGTIHEGHCPAGWDVANLFAFLKTHLSRDDYTAGAFALEETVSGNLHIQFYIECKIPKRPSTMASDFIVTTEAVFDVVRDAKGAWEYCTGTGERHSDKDAFERFEFGTPILYGGTARADLKELVDLVISGADLNEIMRGHPYSYCVHRSRITRFYDDWNYGRGIRSEFVMDQ